MNESALRQRWHNVLRELGVEMVQPEEENSAVPYLFDHQFCHSSNGTEQIAPLVSSALKILQQKNGHPLHRIRAGRLQLWEGTTLLLQFYALAIE